MLVEAIDWTLFARKAIDHGVAVLAGYTLNSAAPDFVPDEIQGAFRASMGQARQKNRALFEELARITEALENDDVEVIVFGGSILAIQAYGDLSLARIEDPRFLVRDSDLARAMETLRRLGYERRKYLKTAQLDLIQRVQGGETLFKEAVAVSIEPRTRLTPMNLALDIDYAGLWRRAERTVLSARTMTTLSSEDSLLVLAVLGGNEFWRRIGAASDVAAFIRSHPKLDWAAILDRAESQGCLRRVLVAAALARRFFGAAVPDAVTAAERHDNKIKQMVRRVAARWAAEEPVALHGDPLWLDGLRLHDGAVRHVRYVARTVMLPGPHHIGRNPFPSVFTSLPAYFPLKIATDVALPLVRTYRYLRAQAKNALVSHEFSLAILPASSELRRHHEARAGAKRALAANPNDATAWHNLGKALCGLKRYEEGIACYDKALELVPEGRVIWKDRSAAIRLSNRTPTHFEEPTLDPQDANGWALRAGFLLASGRLQEAAAASDRALEIAPNHLAAMRMGIRCRIAACDWRQRKEDERRIAKAIKSGLPVITPFNYQTIRDSEAEGLALAQLAAKVLTRPQALWRGEIYRHDRIRVAYISAEFHEHPMSYVAAGVYEHHDKSRFETIAISLGPPSRSDMRRRLEAAFDRFINAQAMSDAEVAAMLRDMEVDIAIDLNGYAGSGRPGIFAHRPAPVQVNYLAYCGTMGTPHYDYIIADHTVIPKQSQIHYSERIAYLPHSHMPNDRTRPIAKNAPTRSEAGLPETGFIFACHNGLQKIGPDTFDIWMRLLRAVEFSVLWLSSPETSAMANLQREAKARGVAPERLVFAPRLPQMENHLARLRLADLFLDTLPYNAHATACDALWAGLPVLTCMGNAYTGRVAASLLHAVGLDELITSSPSEYEALALALARDPEGLAAIKEKLIHKRLTEPLFDTARYTHDLERVYVTMWERARCGKPPESFSLADAPPLSQAAQGANAGARSTV
jgi:predicted O-linked N-acetylglucosamine transferase (SPINDLY family)